MRTATDQPVIVLDACVLAPMPLCDTLLRLAEQSLFIPKWSEEILGEVSRTIQKWGYSPDQALRRVTAMGLAFEEAGVTGYESLIPGMLSDQKDRHVLAAAVQTGADAIVSANVRHFPARCVAPYKIEVLTPDDFLIRQLQLHREQVLATIEAQALRAKRTTQQLFASLSASAPRFSALLRQETGESL